MLSTLHLQENRQHKETILCNYDDIFIVVLLVDSS